VGAGNMFTFHSIGRRLVDNTKKRGTDENLRMRRGEDHVSPNKKVLRRLVTDGKEIFGGGDEENRPTDSKRYSK